ncbi:MAG: hypothetical protein GY938_29365 [Ketobacter sp.]|nr:hypothetical protein [Ketobacter sp.]
MAWETETVRTLIGLLLIVLMHAFYVPISKRLNTLWPSWSAAAGGFAVGYVFLLLLPKLTVLANKGVNVLPDRPMLAISLLYLSTLAGFLCYWMIDLFSADESRDQTRWRKLQITSFFFYGVLTGDMIVADPAFVDLAYYLAIAALLFHLAGMNHLFHHWHPAFFQSRMRWIIILGTLIGALGGWLDALDAKIMGGMNAFMGGAILINVVYYEMPRQANKKMLPFVLGAVAFAVMAIAVRTIASM